MNYYASVEGVVADAMSAWKPPPKLTLSQWSDTYFYLSAESAAQPGRWKSLPYQVGILDAITDPAVTQISVIKSARVGYALAVDTPLPTPAGWTTMGAVSEGDALFDETGRPCRVKFKSPVYVDHDCFRVVFCDGSAIVADAGHRWFVESDVSLEHLSAGRKGRTGRPVLGHVPTFAGVVDTATMAVALRTSRGRNALTIRNATALETPLIALPIPPYTLGLWLGDGHMVSPRITQHRSDVETAQHIEREGIRVAIGYTDSRYPNNASYWLDCGGGRRDPSPWAAKMRALGVLSNKHIPAVYLRAHATQRLELLRGLMDSDGTAGENGRAEFNNTNENLARGVYELVVSLGMKATIRSRPPNRPGYLSQWRVNFKPTPATNPFNLSRKAARVLAPAKPTITMRRRIVSVTPVESVPVQCIEVDSPSSLFLAGRQMVPTHNTKCMDAAIGYFIHQDPSSMLVVQPTVDGVKLFSKEEIAPMMRDVPVLKEIVLSEEEEKGPRDGANTILHKRFPGGVLSMVGANSGAGFRSISRRVVLFDEVDAYPPSAGSDGDPIKLGIRRTEYFWNRKIIAGSTPLVDGRSRIAELFDQGDQRRYFVPCPSCQHMAPLVFNGKEGHAMTWPEGKPEEAFFTCQENGCVIEHRSKRDMVAAGEWRGAKPFAGHASFHIWAAYSYSPNATWGQLAQEFLEAKRGGVEQLKTFVNTVLGETWKEKGDAPEWERLYQRREEYPIGSVPEGVEFITAGVDVQKDRWVYEIVGWGKGKESWSIDAGVIPGDTAREADWFKLDEVLGRTFETTTRRTLPIHALAVDSGFNTQMVYNWARRHVGRVIATKGLASARTILGVPTAVDVKMNGTRIPRGAKVWTVGVDIAKAELYGWLRLPAPPVGVDIAKAELYGLLRLPAPPVDEVAPVYPEGFCHFPQYDAAYFRQLTAEQLVTSVKKTGYQQREWQLIPGRENHYLDCRIYARAAASLVGLDRMGPRATAPAAAPAVAQPRPATSRPDSRFQNSSPRGKSWLGKRR